MVLTGNGEPADWGDPVPLTGAGAFAEVARALSAGFGRNDTLYGFAHHVVETTFLGTSTGLRRRFVQPTGSVEINAKRDGASAWSGISTPWFADVPIEKMLADLSLRLGWARKTVDLPAGRYEDADAAVDGGRHDDLPRAGRWTAVAPGEGRTALSAPGGGVGWRSSPICR